VTSSMLVDRVGRGFTGAAEAPGEEPGWGDLDLPVGRPTLALLASDFTLDGDEGGLSSNDFFFGP